MQIAREKAHLAATNGIQLCIANKSIYESNNYEDNSRSNTELIPWGFYKLATSNGIYNREVTTYQALIGERPSSNTKIALTYTNPEHQLIFTGNIQINGDVEVGSRGITLGTIPQYPTPRRLPIQGNVIRRSFNRDNSSFKDINSQIENYNELIDLVKKKEYSITNGTIIKNGSFDLTKLETDTSDIIFIEQNANLTGKIHCRGKPIQIVINGDVTFLSSEISSLSGPIIIVATGRITLPPSTSIENIILYSQRSIDVLSDSKINAQLIAPRIIIQSNTLLSYPSAVYSYKATGDTTQVERAIRIESGSLVEGFVGMDGNERVYDKPELIIINQLATITGTIVSEEALTLEGRVLGSIITKEFYFYQEPTRYYGWVKQGLIDKNALPSSYLTPLGMNSSSTSWEVLEWL